MKNLLLTIALVCGMFSAQAQDEAITFEVNGGVLTHDFFVDNPIVSGETLQIGQASFGFEGDVFSSKKFNFGPSGKIYTHETEFFGGKSSELNHYSLSAGLVAGVDLGKFTINTSIELPIPDRRESIFEAVISPSAAFMISKRVGIKANFDYFINKKLYNYAYTIGGGLIYKF